MFRLRTYGARLEVLTAINTQVVVLWVVTPCSYVVGYQRFGEPLCLHLHGDVKLEAEWLSGVKVQKTTT